MAAATPITTRTPRSPRATRRPRIGRSGGRVEGPGCGCEGRSAPGPAGCGASEIARDSLVVPVAVALGLLSIAPVQLPGPRQFSGLALVGVAARLGFGQRPGGGL